MNYVWVIKDLVAPDSDRQYIYSSKEQAKKIIRKWIDTIFCNFKDNKIEVIEEEDKTVYEFSWWDRANDRERGFRIAIVKISINNVLTPNWNENYCNDPYWKHINEV